jgi:hypothetical protein
MKRSYIKHQKVLGLSANLRFLSLLKTEILGTYPQIQFYRATNHEDGLQMILSLSFDLVVLELSEELPPALIHLAVSRQFPVLALFNGDEFDEILEGARGLHKCAVFSKSDAKQILPLIEQILRICSLPHWRRALEKAVKLPIWMVRLSQNKLEGNLLDEHLF